MVTCRAPSSSPTAKMQTKTLIIACMLAFAACAAAGSNDDEKVVSRKMLGLFDGMRAVNKATRVVESNLSNSLKAGQKISKSVQQQVKEVINADARVFRQIAKQTDKAISHGERAVVVGVGENINKFANAITAPLVGGGPAHAPHHSAAAKEALKTIKAVEHGKQKVAKSIEHAAQERQQAVNKATKQITKTIDKTHNANGKVKRDAARAINKALGLRP